MNNMEFLSQAVRLANLDTEYDRLLALLGEVITGAIEPGRVIVNTLARTWEVRPVDPPPPH
jgi:hypothetical protein